MTPSQDPRAASSSSAIEGRGLAEPFSLRDGGGVATGPPEAQADHNNGALARALLEGPIGLALLDQNGRVLNANQAACDLLSSGPDELVGRSLVGVLHPDDRGWSEPELEMLGSGAIDRVRQQLRLVTILGDERLIELTIHRAGASVDGTACAVAILEQIGDRGVRARELERLAYTDPLTRCWNRRRFASELDRHLSLSARYGPRGAMLMIDIDGLKQINDTHGHQAGDEAIVATAELLRGVLRASDVTARIGGDEFAVLLPAASREEAAAVARALLAAARTAPGAPGGLALSIGIADIVAAPTDPAGLSARADRSMYQAKRSGGNGYAIDESHDTPPEPQLGRDRAAAIDNDRRPVLKVVDRPAEPIDVNKLLAAIAQLGAASLALVAWELSATEQAVTGAWATATRSGMLERVRYDPTDREWQYGLTERGRQRLRASELEPELERPGDNQRPPAGRRPRHRQRRR